MLTQAQARSKSSLQIIRSFTTAGAVNPSPGWLASSRLAITDMWSTISLWRARRSAIAELRALDDRSLRDIGLLRCEIDQIPRIGPWE